MNIISQLSVLVLLLIIVAAFFMLSRKAEMGGAPAPSGDTERGSTPDRFGYTVKAREPGRGGKSAGKTVLMPILVIEQLHPHTKEVVKTFEVTRIPAEGLTISRPDAQQGTLRLSDEVRSAHSVSEKHLIIAQDKTGIFVQDNHSSNGTRVFGEETRIDEAAVTDGLVLLLGYQPVRFRLNSFNDFFRDYANTGVSGGEKESETQVVRRRK